MADIQRITKRSEAIIDQLLAIWEGAVRETHTFLSEEDIESLIPDVRSALRNVSLLYSYNDGTLLGFIGVENRKIEMLFVDANVRGKGVGKALIQYAIDSLDAKLVDVNEQNEQGVGFYYHLGFQLIGRSELDGQGRPFPILHLELQ